MKKMAALATGIILVAVFSAPAWHRIDSLGWIPHRQVTRVWCPVERPWAVGEYLECRASPLPPVTDPKHNSPGIGRLACARDWEWEDDQSHLRAQDIQVKYWGRIAIPYPESAQLYLKEMTTQNGTYDEAPFRWRCSRNELSVTCWAIN